MSLKKQSCLASGQLTQQDLQTETEDNIDQIINYIEKSKHHILNSYDQIQSHLLADTHHLQQTQKKYQKNKFNPRSNRSEGRSIRKNVSSFQDHLDLKFDNVNEKYQHRTFSSSLKGKQNILQEFKYLQSPVRSKSIKNQSSFENKPDNVHQEYLKKLFILKEERKCLQNINQQNKKNIVEGISMIERANFSNKVLVQNNNLSQARGIYTNSPNKSKLTKGYNHNDSFVKHPSNKTIAIQSNSNKKPSNFNQNMSNLSFQINKENSPSEIIRSKRDLQQCYDQRRRQQVCLNNSFINKNVESPASLYQNSFTQNKELQTSLHKKDYNQIKNQIWKNWDNECNLFQKINLNNSPQFKPRLNSRYRRPQIDIKNKGKHDMQDSNLRQIFIQYDEKNYRLSQMNLQKNKNNKITINNNDKNKTDKDELKINNLTKLIQRQKQNVPMQKFVKTQRTSKLSSKHEPSPQKSRMSFAKESTAAKSKKQLRQSKTVVNSKPMKKIHNRIKSSNLLFEDSIIRNDRYQKNHLSMTYQKQKRARSEICQKICQQPSILKKHKKNFKH